jgi:16S rRNA (adenine1518-N6/adenine1519-N6)-dimethyltransferase
MGIPTRRRPRKSLGQHWLSDPGYLKRIASAAEIDVEETVVEVGAGTGLLTRRLVEVAAKVIAVEVDPSLAARLREKFVGAPNVTVVEADVMALAPEEILAWGGSGLPYVVVGNLPYYIGTPIVRRFLEAAVKPRRMVVMLQSEVAESMCAKPGRMSYLSVQMQLHAETRVLFQVPPRAFRPPPKVRSAVVRLDVRDGPAVEVDDPAAFLEFARAGFAAPRKQLRNSLAVGLGWKGPAVDELLEASGLEGTRRPATLSLGDWRDVYYAYRAYGASR